MKDAFSLAHPIPRITELSSTIPFQIEALKSYKYFYHRRLIEFYLLHNGYLISLKRSLPKIVRQQERCRSLCEHVRREIRARVSPTSRREINDSFNDYHSITVY